MKEIAFCVTKVGRVEYPVFVQFWFFFFKSVPCMWGLTALHDLVEILVAEVRVRVREKETDRWERVN